MDGWMMVKKSPIQRAKQQRHLSFLSFLPKIAAEKKIKSAGGFVIWFCLVEAINRNYQTNENENFSTQPFFQWKPKSSQPKPFICWYLIINVIWKMCLWRERTPERERAWETETNSMFFCERVSARSRKRQQKTIKTTINYLRSILKTAIII